MNLLLGRFIREQAANNLLKAASIIISTGQVDYHFPEVTCKEWCEISIILKIVKGCIKLILTHVDDSRKFNLQDHYITSDKLA